jgi:putative intracellular protease/amidase
MKKILIVLSEWGYWGEELVGPLETFDAAGYQVDFVTPTGKRPVALTPSMDPTFVDPPLGRTVVSQDMAEKVKKLDDPNNPRLNNPKNLKQWLPERPYWSSPKFIREMEAYYRALEEVQKDLVGYDSMLIVGGSGPIVDLVNNQRVHDLILSFYRAGKPVAAECYGVPCLAFARDIGDRKSIIWGKHVTGHCLEYDYKDGTGFMGTDFNMGPPPYPLEYILRDATGPDGQYHGNVGHPTSVIVDYPFVTGRSTPDSYATGQRLVEVLEKGLKRYGW